MKWTYLWLLAVSVSVSLPSCSSDDDDDDLLGNWVRRSDFDGVTRGNATSFIIGNKGYLFGGYDGKDRLKDLWEYDSENNWWYEKASLPDEGSARNSAAGFSIGDRGYIGTGYDGLNYLKDFWEYDPVDNQWTRKADFEGSARYGAVSFTLGNSGYLGCGYSGNYLKDIYKYNPDNNNWELIPFPGTKRVGASAFVIDNKAYLLGGINNQQYVYDFWMFDGENWVQKRDISNTSDDSYDDDYTIVRAYGVAFVINSMGYYTTGESGSLRSATWEYNPIKDLWEAKTSFEGATRTGAVGFSFGNRGFVATGRSSSYRFDDLYEFFPFEEYYQYD